MHHPLRNGALIAAVSLFALTGCSSPGTSADGESLTTVRFGIPTQMGANNVLAKPFTIEKMKAAIEAVFGPLK